MSVRTALGFVLLGALISQSLQKGINGYIVAVLAAPLLAIWLPSLLTIIRKTEVYDLDHALLNLSPPKTLWLNMGYWKDTKSFPQACESLALQLGEFAGLRQGDNILDVGCGCGESLLLWARKFRPHRVLGVTSLYSHRRHAMAAIQAAEDLPMGTQMDVLTAEAVTWTKNAASHLKLEFDKVLALDCIYHFRTREAFLKNAHALLGFGGTFAATDLLLPTRQLAWYTLLIHRFIYYMSGSPSVNMITQEEYKVQLQNLGYTHIVFQDISPHVFPGLSAYIDGISAQPALAAAIDKSKLAQYTQFARVLRWWAKGNMKFVLVRATKGRQQKLQ